MSPDSERFPPAVNLELPIVQELIAELGHMAISYETDNGRHEGTVLDAFKQCGDLSYIGEQSPAALKAIILDAIEQTRIQGPRGSY